MCTSTTRKLGILPNTSMRTRRVLFYVLILLQTCLPAFAIAETSANLSVTPAVIDEKAKQRDIINESITLTNTSDHVLSIYPSVFDVNTVNGQQVFSYAKDASDLAASLANWVELTRGVIELPAGQSKTVPFTMRINMNAKPGQYHAQLTFSTGGTRAEAEAQRPLVTVSVNLEILADIKEEMQLSAFSSDNVVLAGDDVVFKYRVQNIGNQELQPTGEIRIYNRKGEEVASVDVNKSGKTVDPDKEAQLASVWSGADGFGKFKALLTVNYGKGQTAAVQDTVFFWIIPWKQLLGLIAASLIAIAFFALHFHRWFEERHLTKLSAAGLLRTHDIAGLPAIVSAPVREADSRQESPKPAVRFRRRSLMNMFKKRPSIPFVPTFSTFERKRESSAPEAPRHEKPTLREALPSMKPGSQSVQPVRIIADVARSDSGTIDLKNLRTPTQENSTPQDGHVINLKKRL